MKSARSTHLVLVTAPDQRTARRLARAALQQKLVACVNLVPKLESHYWWQGKLEHAMEVLLILKATRKTLPALEKLILAEHPYDTPEFVVLAPRFATARYLKWWLQNCA